MQTSESIEKLNVDLIKFQNEVKNPEKTEKNPYFNSKYAPLSSIVTELRPLLAKYNLGFIQDVEGDGQSVSVTTRLLHSSGEWIETNTLTFPNEVSKGNSTAQGGGSSITYARRYQITSLLGIASEEDNDANGPNQNNKKKKDYNCSTQSNKSSKSKNKSNNYNNQAVKNPAEYKMPFGQKEGTRFKNLDLGYIKWVAEKMDPRNELGEKAQKMAKKYLAQSNNQGSNKSKKDHDYISQMNQLIKGHNELWKEVKDYLNDTVGDSDVKNINNLSEKQFEDLKLLIRGMIPGNDEERVNGEEVPDDEPSLNS